MKAGWEVRPLGELAVFSNGLWKGKKEPFRKAKVLRNTNFRPNGILSYENVAELDVETRQFEKRQLKAGDIILERSGGGPKQPVGRAVFFDKADDDYSFSNFTSVIRLNDKSKIDPRYLHAVLNWWYYSGLTEPIQSNSTSIRNLNFKAYKLLEVPLPPLEEQQRIVAVLDEAFDGLARARAHAEANLQNARELFESYLAASFSDECESWSVCELNDHVKFVDYRGKTPPKTETGIRLITAKTVKMGYIQREPEEFILESAYDDWMTRGFPKLGDVLFTTEAPLANVAQLDTEETVVIGQRLITMQPNLEILLAEFLKFSLMSRPMQDEIHRRGTGATVIGIKAKLLKTVPLRFPPSLGTQRKIAAECRQVYNDMDRLRAGFIAKIQDIDDLRQSLLQKAFAGELT